MVSQACEVAWNEHPSEVEDDSGEMVEVPVDYRLKDLVGVAALARLGKDLLTSAIEHKNPKQWLAAQVSKLSEVFAAMKGKPERHLYLDIKQVDLKKLAEEVRTAHVERQVVLASPKPEQIADWKKLVPQSDTLLWMRGSEEQLRKRIEDLRKTNFEGITQLQVHIFPTKTIDEALNVITPSADKEDISRSILFLQGIVERIEAGL